MKVLKKGAMSDGTKIQIEEWSENYSFMPYGSTIASYPKSKVSHAGSFSPKGNETYRFEFDLNSNKEAEQVFNSLLNGNSVLADHKSKLTRKEYADCI